MTYLIFIAVASDLAYFLQAKTYKCKITKRKITKVKTSFYAKMKLAPKD